MVPLYIRIINIQYAMFCDKRTNYLVFSVLWLVLVVMEERRFVKESKFNLNYVLKK